MSKLSICDLNGTSVGDIDLSGALLASKGKGRQAAHAAVVAHLAERRAGTASTLRKGEVSGSNKKPWRQKGTGRARAGYRQSPVWRGGGVAFGPHPRSYSQKVNKKAGQLAVRRVLTDKVVDGRIKVISELSVNEGRTKEFAALMKGLGIGCSALFVVDKADSKVLRASRNLPGVAVETAANVTAYQMLRHDLLVLTESAAELLKKRLVNNREGRE